MVMASFEVVVVPLAFSAATAVCLCFSVRAICAFTFTNIGIAVGVTRLQIGQLVAQLGQLGIDRLDAVRVDIVGRGAGLGFVRSCSIIV